MKMQCSVVSMADRGGNTSHFQGKKPCRTCTDFKSWMKNGGRNKSHVVRIDLRIKSSSKYGICLRLAQACMNVMQLQISSAYLCSCDRGLLDDFQAFVPGKHY